MDNEKKRLKQEYSRLTSKFERLLRRYASVDPSDEFSDGDDYQPLAPSLVSLVMRGCGREEFSRAVGNFRLSYWHIAVPNPELDLKIADAVLKAYLAKGKASEKPHKQTKAQFRLDLCSDCQGILDYITAQVPSVPMASV